MTTGIVCGGGSIKSKPRLLGGPETFRMDPQFMQLESQLAALRNRRHPLSGAAMKLAAESPARLSSSPATSPRHDVARQADTHGLPGSSLTSLSSLSSSSSATLSQDTVLLHTDTRSPSSSLPSSSSSCSVDSATAAERRDVRDSLGDSQQVAQQSPTTTFSELFVTSEQRQSIAANQRSPSSSSLSPAAPASTTRRRSLQSISEERSRFRIVKIDSYVDRGRWHCHNFADPPMHDADVSSAQYDSTSGADGDDDDAAPPSQIYYIAAGQNDGDLSKRFYVSTIVYGVHGHPVLDRTVQMSPLQFLQRASDDSLSVQTEDGETLTPSTCDNHLNQSPAETPLNHVDDGDKKLLTASGYSDVHSVDDNAGQVASAPETDDVMENDVGNPLVGVAMTAHSSMPSVLTSCSTQSMTSVSDNDGVGRRAMTSRSLSQHDGVEMRCHDDSFGQPACLPRQSLSVDESQSTTRCAVLGTQ